MLFAGLMFKGGVISYEANVQSGGLGARYLGIGNSKQYREDTVIISLRLVSVSTGEVLIETSQFLKAFYLQVFLRMYSVLLKLAQS